jgi:fructose-1,6-bisphosphatase/inositol monophosphatase family enzyme
MEVAAMPVESYDQNVLRYCQQIIMKVMEKVRTSMRGSDRLLFKESVANPDTEKADANPTKAIDKSAEDLAIGAFTKKFRKIPGFGPFTVFSEELGIRTYPPGAAEGDARWVVFIDPIDGTEFIESLQGGWSLMAVYDRQQNEVAAAVAGDIFLDRLYWAVRGHVPEAIDFITHSWFKLDGGPTPKTSLQGARVNVLTTKVSRFLAVAKQERLLAEMAACDARLNLSWGSNLIIQVAAGYADVGMEFDKGFATYDILPGLFIAEQAGLTILDLKGNTLTSRLDMNAIFSQYRKDSKRPMRVPFVAAKSESLARHVVELLD